MEIVLQFNQELCWTVRSGEQVFFSANNVFYTMQEAVVKIGDKCVKGDSRTVTATRSRIENHNNSCRSSQKKSKNKFKCESWRSHFSWVTGAQFWGTGSSKSFEHMLTAYSATSVKRLVLSLRRPDRVTQEDLPVIIVYLTIYNYIYKYKFYCRIRHIHIHIHRMQCRHINAQLLLPSS